MPFIRLRQYPPVPILSVFIMKGCWIFSVEIIMAFVLNFINMVYYLGWLKIVNQPCISTINPTWLWCIIFFVCCSRSTIGESLWASQVFHEPVLSPVHVWSPRFTGLYVLELFIVPVDVCRCPQKYFGLLPIYPVIASLGSRDV